jgi:hypothetical protein
VKAQRWAQRSALRGKCAHEDELHIAAPAWLELESLSDHRAERIRAGAALIDEQQLRDRS